MLLYHVGILQSWCLRKKAKELEKDVKEDSERNLVIPLLARAENRAYKPGKARLKLPVLVGPLSPVHPFSLPLILRCLLEIYQ